MTAQPHLDVAALDVRMHGQLVGRLALAPDGSIAFEYADSWLANGFSISPFSLPLEKRVFRAPLHPFDGLFGVFDDSLPDGWGRLLVDRMLRGHGIEPYAITPLDRLAIVGSAGMGALEYAPEVSLGSRPATADLDELAAECAQMLATDHADDLDALFALGGSSGGARPKALMAIEGEDWIVKFPSSYDAEGIGAQEYAISQVAQACGIVMPETRLLPSRECAGYFAIRRFDRPEGSSCQAKVHMVSAGGLLEASHRVPSLDYDLLMRLALRLTGSMGELERLYRLMAFNVHIGNRDDHAKNFSFIYDEAAGAWQLSPAYDLTCNPGINGEHATMVNGRGRGITNEDIVAVGMRAGLSARRARAIEDEVCDAVRAAREDGRLDGLLAGRQGPLTEGAS